jgi:hypothetical protein
VTRKPGRVRIRIFDEAAVGWLERAVNPMTLRPIDPYAADLLEKQERWGCPQLLYTDQGATAPGCSLAAGSQQTPREIVKLRRIVGRARDRDADRDIRIAYRVLVEGESVGAIARAVGVTSERTRYRVLRALRTQLWSFFACSRCVNSVVKHRC